MLRFLFALFFLSSTPFLSQCDGAGPDLQPLLDLYRNTNGPNWINDAGWNLGDQGLDCDYCSWAGVTCNAEERVVRLLLVDNQLQVMSGNELYTQWVSVL